MEFESKSCEKTWVIPSTMCEGGMHGVIGGINSFMVFPHKPVGIGRKEPHTQFNGAVEFHQVESFSWLLGHQARKLINESMGTFMSLQTAIEVAGPNDIKPILVKKCHEYRSMIQANVEDINEKQDSPNTEEQTELANSGELLYKMEMILHFIELIFIDTHPGGVIMGKLLKWIQFVFNGCMTKMEEALSADHPYLHHHYWESIYGLVLQNRMEEARHLLSLHPNATSDSFLSIDEMLRKMPVYQVYGGVSDAEFNVRWQHWQGECDRRLKQGEFSTCHQLATICKILCGDQDTIISLVDLMDTWYHLMVSTLLFTTPTVKLFRLVGAAKDAIAIMGGEDRTTPLDHILLAAIEADAHQVIKQCQHVLDNHWFSAHITDLLCHTLNQKSDTKFLPELRESLLLDYASVLVGHPSLWQVGVLYLDHCGSAGSAMAQEVLQRFPLTSDSKAQKIIHMAKQRGFDHVEMTVCRVMGRRSLAQGRLSAAIWWGVRSRDSLFTSHLAHQILHKYLTERKFESSPLLDHLGPAMLLSDTLTFLGKYREFHTLYQDGLFQQAANLLVSLISSKLSPEYFWPILLLDALPLLTSKELVISSEQTYELMYCLNNLSFNKNNMNKRKDMDSVALNTGAILTFTEKEEEIRLALTKNLAKAIFQEGTIIS